MSINRALFKSTSIVSAMTMLSRVLGMARDMLMAALFGAGGGYDAFTVAFKIPNFMRSLSAEGSFSQAFVPVLAEYRQTRSHEDTMEFMGRMLGFLAFVLFLITILAEILAPLIVLIFAPGFLHDPDRFHMAATMVRITFPYMMLISITAFFGAILNSFGSFGSPAFSPVLLNLSMIGAAIYLAPHFHIPEAALAWGVLIAGFLQLFFQVPFLWRKQLLPKMHWGGWRDEGVRRVLRLMVPALFGVSVTQIGLLIDTVFASFLPEGSISWLYFSDRLALFPVGVFGVALATVVLPHLSRQHADGSSQNFRAALDWALRCLLVISVPAAVGLFIMSGPLIATFFQYLVFSGHDVLMTQKSVIAFSLGLPGFMAVKILSSAFYSRQDIRTPVRVGIIATCANIILNFLFIIPLAHAGLALATTLSSTLNACLLYFILVRIGVHKPLPGWRKYLLQLAFANFVMGTVLWFGPHSTNEWIQASWQFRVWNLLIWVTLAVFVYFITLWGSGLRLKDFKVKHSVEVLKEGELATVKIDNP